MLRILASTFLTLLAVMSSRIADARPLPKTVTLEFVQRILTPCGVKLVGETPNMQSETQGAWDRRHGGGQYSGDGHDTTDRDGRRHPPMSAALFRRAYRIHRLDLEAVDQETFDLCGRRLIEASFPDWANLKAWLDAATALPRPDAPAFAHPGPERQAVQDGLYITVWGHSVTIVSAEIDRDSSGGLTARETSLSVPAARRLRR